MIRFLFRIIGFWLFAAAFVALVIDGARSVTSGALIITSMGEAWFNTHSESLNIAQAAIQRNVLPYLWDPIIVWILQGPSWVVVGVIALIFLTIGKKRRSVVEA